MELNQLIMMGVFGLSWITALWIGGAAFRRYVPVALFSTLVVSIVFETAYTLRWWELESSMVPWNRVNNLWFVFGPFFVFTLWIFKLTFRRFGLFLLVNVGFDAFQMFVFSPWLEARKLYTLVNIERWQVFLLMLAIAILLYLYQLWFEHTFSLQSGPRGDSVKIDLPTWRGRRKAR
ncbi:hypothetical protein [Paenibacillus turpanensis]|uniref:hypothetical protein n=1 Tax=Paenibacillus turpanensis TaxID=2689078 RepID=UPI00140B5308|nr:hypothetical protein [Paenibacillus turpanensis]